MKENLSSRGCTLLGIDACPDLAAQERRFHDNGWNYAWAVSMDQVYFKLLPKDDVKRYCIMNIARYCNIFK